MRRKTSASSASGRAGAMLTLLFVATGMGALAQSRPDGATQITTPPGSASDQNPAFSPAGARLVFTRFDNGYNNGPAGIFLVDLGSLAVTRVSPVENQDNVNLPGSAWNSVLDRIVLASDRVNANDLWRIAPSGADFSRITTHGGVEQYIEPSWSPDGQWIVFESTQPGPSSDGRVSQIWKVKADGSSLTQLTGTPGLDDRQPNWAPNGNLILFQRRTLPGDPFDLYTMLIDGTGIANVTSDPVSDDTDASFAPDSSMIVYSSDRGGLPQPNLFAIATAGGAPVRVTNATVADGAPSWSPDGLTIAFESHANDTAPAALWRIGAPPLPITADFVGAPLTGPAPLLVQFTDLSLGAITTWAWDFGDGGTASGRNPSHVYGGVGSYPVTLTVTGTAGSNTAAKPGYITVIGSSPIENFYSGKGRGQPNANDVAIHALGGGAAKATWLAYSAGQWGTLVAAGDVDGNGVANALTGPGPGAVYGPQVRAFQPDGATIAKVNFYAYGTLRYGVNVAGADIDGDASAEILSGAGPGAVFGPHVRAWNFDGVTLTPIAKVSFFSYGTLKYGVNVDDGDVDGDGIHEILTGPGPSSAFGPSVRGFNYDGAALAAIGKINFSAFSSGGYGVIVAGGSPDGDAFDEIAVGRGPGPTLGAQVRGYDYDATSIAFLAGFDLTPFATTYGARVSLGDIDGDGTAELVAGPGEDPSAPAALLSYDYSGATLDPIAAGSFAPFSSSYGVISSNGVFGF